MSLSRPALQCDELLVHTRVLPGPSGRAARTPTFRGGWGEVPCGFSWRRAQAFLTSSANPTYVGVSSSPWLLESSGPAQPAGEATCLLVLYPPLVCLLCPL